MIDTAAIRRAASGDKTKKVAVTKAWLIAVADEIDKNRKYFEKVKNEQAGNQSN